MDIVKTSKYVNDGTHDIRELKKKDQYRIHQVVIRPLTLEEFDDCVTNTISVIIGDVKVPKQKLKFIFDGDDLEDDEGNSKLYRYFDNLNLIGIDNIWIEAGFHVINGKGYVENMTLTEPYTALLIKYIVSQLIQKCDEVFYIAVYEL